MQNASGMRNAAARVMIDYHSGQQDRVMHVAPVCHSRDWLTRCAAVIVGRRLRAFHADLCANPADGGANPSAATTRVTRIRQRRRPPLAQTLVFRKINGRNQNRRRRRRHVDCIEEAARGSRQ